MCEIRDSDWLNRTYQASGVSKWFGPFVEGAVEAAGCIHIVILHWSIGMPLHLACKGALLSDWASKAEKINALTVLQLTSKSTVSSTNIKRVSKMQKYYLVGKN